MSILGKCDICGKMESNKINISDEPLKLQIVNHKKEPYNIYVKVSIEADVDTKTHDELTKLVHNTNSKQLK